MNVSGLTPGFMDSLEKGSGEVFETLEGSEMKEEYLLPVYIGELLREGKVSVKVLETSDKWFGVAVFIVSYLH